MRLLASLPTLAMAEIALPTRLFASSLNFAALASFSFASCSGVLAGAAGLFGFGELTRLNEAYDALCTRWTEGTTAEDRAIDIVGFSRGAATALDFCNLVQDRGIRKPGSGEVVEGMLDVADRSAAHSGRCSLH